LAASLDVFSLRMDLGYGAMAGVIGSATGAPGIFVQQAFGSLTLGQITLDFGKFNTTAGAEVIEANANWLYSRSFLFFSIPLVHTGVRASFKASDALTLQASLVNGWNVDPDNNAGKTGGLSLALTPNKMTSIYVTTYFGKETTADNWRILGDLVAALSLTDTFGLNINVDYVKDGEAYVVGGSVMGKVSPNEHVNVAFRGEYLYDKAMSFGSIYPTDPLTMAPLIDHVNVFELTLMLGIPVSKNFELRLENRLDYATEILWGNGKKYQDTILAAALAYF
jgi:hypothetical protein